VSNKHNGEKNTSTEAYPTIKYRFVFLQPQLELTHVYTG